MGIKLISHRGATVPLARLQPVAMMPPVVARAAYFDRASGPARRIPESALVSSSALDVTYVVYMVLLLFPCTLHVGW